MKTLAESVITSMDGSDKELFQFLPYILQDIWEIGTSPEVIIKLIRKHTENPAILKVLDLGCGKGAVAIKIAKEFNCNCIGIDAIKEFIKEAKNKAKKYRVEKLCRFEVEDVRERVKELNDFDVIILGAIGPVFGDYNSTLSILSKCLKQDGVIIIDDGYIEDNSSFTHSLMAKKSTILKQISDAGMQLLDEVVINEDEIKNSDDYMLRKIKNRCHELNKKYPAKAQLFNNYLKKQEEENDVLENRVICSTMLIKRMNKQSEKSEVIKRLQTLRNIGPKMAEKLYALGIKTPVQMKESNPEELFKRLQTIDDNVDPCELYVFRGAILDVPWPKCKNVRKYSKGRLKNKLKRR